MNLHNKRGMKKTYFCLRRRAIAFSNLLGMGAWVRLLDRTRGDRHSSFRTGLCTTRYFCDSFRIEVHLSPFRRPRGGNSMDWE